MQGLQDGDYRSRSRSPTLSRTDILSVSKRRTSANSPEQILTTSFNALPSHRALSLNTGPEEQGASARSPIAHEHENGFAPSGLQRIRQQPTSRQASSTNLLHRSSSMTISIPSSGDGTATGPPSPLLTASDDLMRFPSESLHSFSFTQQSDDFMHLRYNVLKRSMDLLKEKGMWAAGGLGVANAQAKASGDTEVQGMMELLDKANLLGKDGINNNGLGLSNGPLTGPAHTSAENPFERSFTPQYESESAEGGEEDEVTPVVEGEGDALLEKPHLAPSFTFNIAPELHPLATSPPLARPRPGLKRTYTDIAHLSLQSKLTAALAQPYLANDTLLSPITSFQAESMSFFTPAFPSSQPHAHGRAAPTTQAIFTTEAQPPWTITASNDLACLAFGVQRTEIRKLSILDIVREDKRKWLETKLSHARPTSASASRASPPSSKQSMVGHGITAKLLGKPSSREIAQSRRTHSDDGPGTSITSGKNTPKPLPATPKSRGVLLCGDVVPIQKRNGDVGSATLWVQEKRDKLIWVMEEIVEDVAYLGVDEVGCITKASGRQEAVWGMERVRRGMDITRLLPHIPRLKGTNTGALDYAEIARLRRYTARTLNDISVPVTVDEIAGEDQFRVSSFPHIAGMVVLSASTLRVSSSNAVVAEALFGRSPNGMAINEIIPGFDKMLNMLVDEDRVQLIEGMVVPEQSFRRARAMLAIREGKADAAAVFLRPNGIPALHRDGAEIMIDVQMRIVKSETLNQSQGGNTIEERAGDEEDEDDPGLFMASSLPSTEVVYALWVTYSRSLHAVNHGVGPVSPLISRPGTPPHQLTPGHTVTIHEDSESDGAHSRGSTSSSHVQRPVSPKPDESQTRTTESAPTQTIDLPDTIPKKESISDYLILEDMGAGAYGQVKLARPKSPPSAKKVVIKYVTKRRILVDTWTRDRRLGTVPLEIHVLDYLRRDGFRHPNIVEMTHFFEDDINYYICMRPHGLPGMDLFDYIELRANMSEDECREIMRQVVDAVRFLHVKAKVVHRDIKDENVILDGAGQVKLVDFGSANYVKNGPFDVFVGTIDYAAPEVLSGAPYSGLAQDVWALGILLYTILYKENPFYSIDEIMDHDLRVPYVVSDSSINLVRRCLERDTEKRATIEEVAAHNWFAEDRGIEAN